MAADGLSPPPPARPAPERPANVPPDFVWHADYEHAGTGRRGAWVSPAQLAAYAPPPPPPPPAHPDANGGDADERSRKRSRWEAEGGGAGAGEAAVAHAWPPPPPPMPALVGGASIPLGPGASHVPHMPPMPGAGGASGWPGSDPQAQAQALMAGALGALNPLANPLAQMGLPLPGMPPPPPNPALLSAGLAPPSAQQPAAGAHLHPPPPPPPPHHAAAVGDGGGLPHEGGQAAEARGGGWDDEDDVDERPRHRGARDHADRGRQREGGTEAAALAAPGPRRGSSADDAREDAAGGSELDSEYKRWKNAIVVFSRPFLDQPFHAREIGREEYKRILKKVADKVVAAHRAKHAAPPPKCAIPDSQAASIKKLIDGYLEQARAQQGRAPR